MLRVGLTGGLGCGKSFVAAELARLGCEVIHADLIGHEVLAASGTAYQPVIHLFGEAILNADGRIDRARLAALVFEDAAKLAALNAIVHPAVRRREEEIFAKMGAHSIGVLEAAIVIENGSYRDYDRLVVVWCEPALQLERALARDPLAERATVMGRLARQMPALEKRKYANFLIDTNGSKEETLCQTQDVFRALVTIEKEYEG